MTTTALPTLTARTPEDVLAAVPLVLGFLPVESVVMLTFVFQFAAGVKLTAARAAFTFATLPDTVHTPVLAL